MSASDTKKRVFVVLGMSRSGTSAIARAMTVLGIDLGDHLIAAKNINPTGVFEDADILYNVNRGVSAILGNPWISTNIFEKVSLESNQTLLDYKHYAVRVLKKRFDKNHQWGFKDPRTIAILPFWQSVFNEAAVDDSYVIAMRHPLASAYSNQKFVNIDIEEALLLWLSILISAIDGTQGKKRVLVSYEAMLTDPRFQLERMQRDLVMATTPDQRDVDEYTHHFLDEKLRHYAANQDELNTHPAIAIAPLCSRVYALLSKVACDQMYLDSEVFQAEWLEIKKEFAIYHPVYHYIKNLLVRNRELQNEIRTIKKSVTWKMLSPLYKLSDRLRSLRHKRNDKKRVANIYA